MELMLLKRIDSYVSDTYGLSVQIPPPGVSRYLIERSAPTPHYLRRKKYSPRSTEHPLLYILKMCYNKGTSQH